MPDNKNNILVIKLSALGDFIQALGPMQAIRKHYSGAQTTLLTTKPFLKFAQETGYFDNIIIDERPRYFELGKWANLRKELRSETYAHVFDLQNNGRVKKYYKPLLKQGFEWHSTLSLNEREEHAHTRHKKILKRAGISRVPLDKMLWAGKNTNLKSFDISDSAKFALIVPGCDPSRPEKRWPADKYGELALHLNEQGIIPVIIGTAAEDAEAQVIAKSCPEAISLIGKTSLFDIPALARKAVIAIGNDTGPMHMAGPTGCISLVLFSKHSDPVKHAPIGDAVNTIQVNDLKSDLSVDVVLSKVNDLI